MAARYKVIVLAVATACVVVCGWTISYASYPGRWPAGYPYSLRLPEFIYVVPGVHSVVAWEARANARQAHDANRRLLLGMYQNGSEFGLRELCQLVSYERDTFREEDLPTWASAGVKGTARLLCSPAAVIDGEFTVLEIGCIAHGADHYYARVYNREAVDLAVATTRARPARR